MAKDKKKLLEELMVEKEDIKRIKKIAEEEKVEKKEKKEEKEKRHFLIALANSIFRGLSLKISQKEFFQNYKLKLRRASIALILSSYLSLMFFITLITFIFLFIFSIVLSINTQNFLLALVKNFFISLACSIVIFFLVFFYPSIKLKNEERKIEAELPFAALYMASISSAGIHPAKVMELMSNAKEYPSVAREIRKVVNQIRFFGMDIVSAIKSTNKIIANKELAEMLNGIATNIVTGGNLKAYFEEQARKALTDYKIRREKFTESAGIYSDIYTGLLIAAPLIFMLILVLVNAFGGTLAGLTPPTISIFGIIGLIILNIIFLIYLQIVTPPI